MHADEAFRAVGAEGKACDRNRRRVRCKHRRRFGVWTKRQENLVLQYFVFRRSLDHKMVIAEGLNVGMNEMRSSAYCDLP